jgi:hypothetical protein
MPVVIHRDQQKLYGVCPEPLLITIFVQERERGSFNLARNEASREHRESKVERGRAVGRATASNYL